MGNTKELVKQAVGTVLLPLMPSRVQTITQNEFSMTVGDRNVINTCLRAALARKLLRTDQVDVMMRYHQNFWSGEQGTEFHRHVRGQVLDVFEADYRYLINEINSLVETYPQINTLVEIGAGGGSFLQILRDSVVGIEQWIGNDLSAEIISENRQLYPTIDWVSGDGKVWVEDNGKSNTIYLTFRGVLEYFTQANLASYFATIAKEKSPSAIVLVEPISLEHDLITQSDSRAYGTEYSFSHNYPVLLAESGFTIRHQKLTTFNDHRLCAIIATVGI